MTPSTACPSLRPQLRGQLLGQVAVPDYAGGAMENAGLITFRESYLLADPLTAGLQERMGVANIVAHEMSHMVFASVDVLHPLSLPLAPCPPATHRNVHTCTTPARSRQLRRRAIARSPSQERVHESTGHLPELRWGAMSMLG